MNSIRTQLKRLCSMLLAFVLVLGCFPVYASATFDSSAGLYVTHKKEFAETDITASSLTPASGHTLSPEANLMEPEWLASETSINLYVTSSDMTEEEINSCAVPHVVDEDGPTYYLQRIMWGDRSSKSSLNNSDYLKKARKYGQITG